MGLGAASVKAQVRIGGNTPPNPAAALDLNAAEGTTTETKGLALPRVTLGSNTARLDGTTANIIGMLVYNTSGSLSTGVYYWNGSIWNRVDDAIGNEITDTIAGGGLTKSGSGTAADPWKVGIKVNGVTSTMISDSSILGHDIASGSISRDLTTLKLLTAGGNFPATAPSGYYVNVPYPAGFGISQCWFNYSTAFSVDAYIEPTTGTSVRVTLTNAVGVGFYVNVYFYCFK